MKMDELAYTEVDRLAVVSLRIESCSVPESHRFRMPPSKMERFIYLTSGCAVFSVGCGRIRAGERDMVYLPRNTEYSSLWLTLLQPPIVATYTSRIATQAPIAQRQG